MDFEYDLSLCYKLVDESKYSQFKKWTNPHIFEVVESGLILVNDKMEFDWSIYLGRGESTWGK